MPLCCSECMIESTYTCFECCNYSLCDRCMKSNLLNNRNDLLLQIKEDPDFHSWLVEYEYSENELQDENKINNAAYDYYIEENCIDFGFTCNNCITRNEENNIYEKKIEELNKIINEQKIEINKLKVLLLNNSPKIEKDIK